MTKNAVHTRGRSRKARTLTLLAAGAAVAGGAVASAGHAAAGQEAAPGGGTGLAPFIDTSLTPAHDMAGTAGKTGVKQFNLGFVTAAGGGCTPKWGGKTELDKDPVAKQIEELRGKGGDVRVSFGGAAGSELAQNCSSPQELENAYAKVVDAYGLKKVDFDIEGGALSDAAANTKRAQAIAGLQNSHKDLDVSFTLPVMPDGLTPSGTALLDNAKKNGVTDPTVNIMAMDYGPSYDGDMGQYAIDAATATHQQVKKSLGATDPQAWKKIAVTPMIGVNDVKGEIFTQQDAAQLKKFAGEKNLAWLSMWSANRDKACPGGANPQADPTCSGITQEAGDFTDALKS